MSLGTSNRDGGKTSESGHLRALATLVTGDVIAGLNAVQRAAGVNMSVDVQVGDAFVRRSDGSYAHPVFNDAVYNQVISAADGSNPRRDIVVIYVDYGQTPSTAVSNNTNGVVKIKVVNGTPAGSPVDPSAPTIQASVGAGNPYSILARVRVPAGQTSISNSLIDDLRSMTTANQTAITWTNTMTTVVPISTSWQNAMSLVMPATTVAHKYLINVTFNFTGISAVETTARIAEGTTSIRQSYINPSSAAFSPLPLTAIYTSPALGGQTINLQVSRTSGSGGTLDGTWSHYSIVDLGRA